jgi:hypothetical protein
MNKQQKQLLESIRRPDGRYAVRDIIAVTEFRGKGGVDYPDNIPFSEGVDVEALTEGDEKPFFATLKIGHAGVTSGNFFYYGEDEVNEILRQTITKRPTGGRGHLRDDELGSALPANPLHWVGALRKGEFAWGKGYVAPGDTRDWLRRMGATNAEVATSIFGYADEVTWDEEREAFRIVLHAPDENGHTGFTLEYIDLASPERAGVPTLAVVPRITSEMTRGEQPETEVEVDKLDVLKALTAEDIKHLPDAVIKAVVAQSETAKELADAEKVIGELRTLLGLDERGDVVATVKAQVEATAKATAAAVEAKITELVNTIKVESVRPMVRDMVTDQKPATVEAVQAAFDHVMARESVKSQLAGAVTRTMGPRQERPAAHGEQAHTFLKPKPEAAATS